MSDPDGLGGAYGPPPPDKGSRRLVLGAALVALVAFVVFVVLLLVR